MPPPGSQRQDFPLFDDLPIDPNEPTYCICHQVSFEDMIACDNENCQGGEWFHYSCFGLTLRQDSGENGSVQLAESSHNVSNNINLCRQTFLRTWLDKIEKYPPHIRH